MRASDPYRSKGKKMTDPMCPETGTPMKRGVAPMTLAYKDRSATFEMSGWYCAECGESIHTGEGMKVSDRVLDRLKARTKNPPAAQPAATAGPILSSR